MIRKYLLPMLATLGIGFAVYTVARGSRPVPAADPVAQPARAPYAAFVAGTGMVEAETENIAMGSPVPGLVVEVLVQVGQHVAAGGALFRLDDRELQAERRVQEAAVASAEAQLTQLERQPRPELLPISEAQVADAGAELTMQEFMYRRIQELAVDGNAAAEEIVRNTQALEQAKARLARARSDLALLKAGAWQQDKAVAQAAVEMARARREQVATEIERRVVRALVESDVLKVDVRPGEFVGAPAGKPLVILGAIQQLHVRVSIDEHDIPRFSLGAPAKATLRGHPEEEFDLAFVRVEPYVVPKLSLTGDNTERVDTRVLQVIYAIAPTDKPLYVGQQLDVFVKARSE